jgi:Domain of unknown function (DUF4126)
MDANDGFLFATQLAMGFALAATVGLRAFLPLFVAGLLARHGYVGLGESFEWMQSTPALIVFGSAVVFEILADKVPMIDHALDAAGVLIKPVAGTLVAAALLTNVDPVVATVLGLIGGGVIAGTVHAVKGTARIFSTGTTAGAGNPILSFIEDALATFGIIVAVLLPILAAILVMGLVILGVSIFRRRREREDILPSGTRPSS